MGFMEVGLRGSLIVLLLPTIFLVQSEIQQMHLFLRISLPWSLYYVVLFFISIALPPQHRSLPKAAEVLGLVLFVVGGYYTIPSIVERYYFLVIHWVGPFLVILEAIQITRLAVCSSRYLTSKIFDYTNQVKTAILVIAGVSYMLIIAMSIGMFIDPDIPWFLLGMLLIGLILTFVMMVVNYTIEESIISESALVSLFAIWSIRCAFLESIPADRYTWISIDYLVSVVIAGLTILTLPLPWSLPDPFPMLSLLSSGEDEEETRKFNFAYLTSAILVVLYTYVLGGLTGQMMPPTFVWHIIRAFSPFGLYVLFLWYLDVKEKQHRY